ncbi:MAG: hypothetical protein E7666_04380 [Ruminococcaceae bacterium]|nr:hypothetical protein [Oscillospiraceae bacterium]
MIFQVQNHNLNVDYEKGALTSLTINGRELVADRTPLFSVRLMAQNGDVRDLTAYDAERCTLCDGGAVYTGFPEAIAVTVACRPTADAWEWRIAVENRTDCAVEAVVFPDVILKPLAQNGGDATVLYPYNEGALISDAELRQKTVFASCEPEYPSLGSYSMFPNMLCSQFQCYLTDGYGLYMGVHDASRAPKAIDFYPDGAGVRFFNRLFGGTEFGGNFTPDYAVVWKPFAGDWQDGAELYRQWFESNLPQGAKKIPANEHLPAWYADSPLVVTYPVRGLHDTDEMTPNAFFPYQNALPTLDRIADETQSRLLVLLMHWEGTAPWAPPHVWPPYGGEAMLTDFCNALHERGHLLGVYCSGFGWTEQSNLIREYNRREEYQSGGLSRAMCAGRDGEVLHSRICRAQRVGYDLCVKSPKAQEILEEAYRPLLDSSLDYVQILDQNHGGGQYFCYARDHGHPPVPGAWMTETMQTLLSGWRDSAHGKLFGCESAAAEAFLPQLLFSDNRFELNWYFGEPVPLYAYLYHEYLRNFMGNQVSCGLWYTKDSMRTRMAYSFVAGDCMTLVLSPTGGLMSSWGGRGRLQPPDYEKTVRFAANMTRFYREEAGRYLYCGRMIKPIEYRCAAETYPTREEREVDIPCVLSTAWERDGERVQIFVNHTDCPETVTLSNGRSFTVPPLSGEMIQIES